MNNMLTAYSAGKLDIIAIGKKGADQLRVKKLQSYRHLSPAVR